MAIDNNDTIAAIATAPGRAGIGIVRVSGPQAAELGQRITGKYIKPGRFVYTPFLDSDNSIIDQGVALYFAAPHSYTGEHVLELQGHGSPAILQLLLQRVLSAGVRLARPGEFTERAFLNDRIDLAQAEAVADLIDASSVTAARAAVRSLSGEFSAAIQLLLTQLIELRVYVEAALDFAEEEIDFLADDELHRRASRLSTSFSDLLRNVQQGRLLNEGMTVVLAGLPNVGKSSLLNRLTGTDAAIVTEIAGTTRDVLREDIHLDGLPIRIIDTAGLHQSQDIVEREGMRRTRRAIEDADRLLWVTEAGRELSDEEHRVLSEFPVELPVDLICNKSDLLAGTAVSHSTQGTSQPVYNALYLSALTGDGVETLVEHLKTTIGYQQGVEGAFIARQRHVDALQRAAVASRQAVSRLQQEQAAELAAEDLRLAQQALSEITGEFSSDDLLGEIFAGFCIGK